MTFREQLEILRSEWAARPPDGEDPILSFELFLCAELFIKRKQIETYEKMMEKVLAERNELRAYKDAQVQSLLDEMKRFQALIQKYNQ